MTLLVPVPVDAATIDNEVTAPGTVAIGSPWTWPAPMPTVVATTSVR